MFYGGFKNNTADLLDVKSWDDETDMDAVKTIAMDGLMWGTSKQLPIGHGINKLQVICA